MKIKFLWIGRVKQKAFDALLAEYQKRLSHYCKLEIAEAKELKGRIDSSDLRRKEAELLMRHIQPQDFVILLDERGKQMGSVDLSTFVQDKMNQSKPSMVFIIGGAFGVDSSVFERADFTWSLSKLTLTHDMARMLLMEQVYRAFTILKGEKYHNA